MDSALLSLAISGAGVAVTAMIAWVGFHQKVSVDKFTQLQTELRDAKVDLSDARGELDKAQQRIDLLEDQEEKCRELLNDTRARYEQRMEDLTAENLRLMRKVLGLDGMV